jgi:hypothetical protein
MTGNRRTLREQLNQWLDIWANGSNSPVENGEEEIVVKEFRRLIKEHTSISASSMSVPGRS